MALLSRRKFLRTGITGGALMLGPALRSQPQTPAPLATGSEPGRARNVIFLVSDGMSLGTLTMAERYRRRHEGRGTNWFGLYDRPDVRRAAVDTSSANSLVTDSSAASSAWGCGHKVNNGAINFDPDGRTLTPIMHLARAAGLGTGLVSTASITHATPAGFASQVARRSDEEAIAAQYLAAVIDVLLGGGAQFFDPARRADRRDLPADYVRAGYHVVRDHQTLRAAPADSKLLGLFANRHLPYTLDHRADPALAAAVPTLADLARAALSRLARQPRGFILQIEGARVDHAAHANDIGGLIFDQLAFDDAVGAAVEFAAGRDDTLVILTTDHGNANPGLNGAGGNYGETGVCFDRIAQFRRTNAWTLGGLNAGSTAPQVQERVKEATNLALAEDELDLLRRALRKEHREGYRVRNAPIVALGQILSNYTSVGWTGTSHTTDYVELAAFGPGSENLHGLVQNTALFGMMTRALGLTVPA